MFRRSMIVAALALGVLGGTAQAGNFTTVQPAGWACHDSMDFDKAPTESLALQ